MTCMIFFPSLVKHNYENNKFSPKGKVNTNINFNEIEEKNMCLNN